MGTLSEKFQDEVCRNTKILCDCKDATTTYAKRRTLKQSSNLFAALILTLFCDEKFNLEQLLPSCKEGVANFHPRNVNRIRETIFDKRNSFGVKYTCEPKLFKILATFDIEKSCVQEEAFRDTNTTTGIGKQVPISVSNSFKSYGRTNLPLQL